MEKVPYRKKEAVLRVVAAARLIQRGDRGPREQDVYVESGAVERQAEAAWLDNPDMPEYNQFIIDWVNTNYEQLIFGNHKYDFIRGDNDRQERTKPNARAIGH